MKGIYNKNISYLRKKFGGTDIIWTIKIFSSSGKKERIR